MQKVSSKQLRKRWPPGSLRAPFGVPFGSQIWLLSWSGTFPANRCPSQAECVFVAFRALPKRDFGGEKTRDDSITRKDTTFHQNRVQWGSQKRPQKRPRSRFGDRLEPQGAPGEVFRASEVSFCLHFGGLFRLRGASSSCFATFCIGMTSLRLDGASLARHGVDSYGSVCLRLALISMPSSCISSSRTRRQVQPRTVSYDSKTACLPTKESATRSVGSHFVHRHGVSGA